MIDVKGKDIPEIKNMISGGAKRALWGRQYRKKSL